jgi:hypothetical protein
VQLLHAGPYSVMLNRLSDDESEDDLVVATLFSIGLGALDAA